MEELRYASDEVEAIVLPVLGARLHRLRAFGHDLLRTPSQLGAYAREPFFWGCFVMAPWCNRIATQPVQVGGRRVALTANFSDGTAIHGQVYNRAWQAEADGALTIMAGADEWPWAYEVSQRVSVVGPVLRIGLELVNRSDEPMPAGMGLHPWFRRPLQAAIHGRGVHPDNTDSAPRPDAPRGRFDLHRLGAVPDGLDATWTQAASPLGLAWPNLGIEARMHIEAPAINVVAASPSELDAIAIEPQTHAPHGLRRLLGGEPGGLAMLRPGGSLRLGVVIEFGRV